MQRNFARTLSIVIVGATIAITLTLVAMGLSGQHAFNPPYLRFGLNIIFIVITNLTVAIISAKSFLKYGQISLLILSCGLLASSLSTFSSGWAANSFSDNANFSIFALGMLISAIVQAFGAIYLSSGAAPKIRKNRTKVLAVTVTAIIISIIIVTAVGITNAVVFKTDIGPTPLRQLVVAFATLFFALSATIFGLLYRQSKTSVLYWYFMALLLFAIGTGTALGATEVGGILQWTARSIQYIGGIYFLILVLSLRQQESATFSESWYDNFSANKQQYSALFSQMLNGFLYQKVVTDKSGQPFDTTILEVNEAFERDSGLLKYRIVGKRLTEAIPGIEKEQFDWIGNFIAIAIQQQPKRFTAHLQALDRWFNVSAYSPEQGYVISLFEDITAKKKAENDLRKSEQRWATTLSSIGDAVIATDILGRVTFMNPTAEALTGWSNLEAKEKSLTEVFQIVNEQTKKPVESPVDKVLAQGLVVGLANHTILISKNGEQIPIDDSGAPIIDQGQIIGVVLVFRDITKSKEAEEIQRKNDVLQATYAYTRSLLEASLDPLMTISTAGKITDVNKATEDATGCSRIELIGTDFADYFTDSQKAREGYQKVLSDGSIRNYSLVMKSKDGSKTDVLYNAALYRDANREIQGVFAAARDISEIKAKDEELKQLLEKLKASNAELEQFAYVASHDLQEPLRMVASYVQLLERRYKGKLDEDADVFIGYAVDGANRMRSLIEDLLTYSRVTRLGKPFEPTNLQFTMEIVLKILKSSITETNAAVTYDKLPTIEADSGQMVQLFQNLVGNGIKFHGKEPPKVSISAKSQGSKYLFAVTDNGIGIDPHYSDRLFKIFQRLHNKEEYSGSGIGLVICKRIVERHGGKIWIDSQVGKGSTIYFTLNKKLKVKHNEEES
jgi:PAS domain S-box-containing protein